MMPKGKPTTAEKPIDGIPSKDLFISMLIKDITLKDAIGDLVDNSVDGANCQAGSRDNLSHFNIKIVIDKRHFEILDNCGGIEEEIARKSAFKLGKPKDYVFNENAIGQFGIGMKRAFFKIGELITVESIALKSSFRITIPVVTWKNDTNDEDWNFKFDVVHTKENNRLNQTKTLIKIEDLKEDTKKQFSDPQFLIELKKEIALEHFFALKKGLNISINNEPLKAPKITMLLDDDFHPAYWSHSFQNGLSAEIIAGASEDLGDDGGWYIFCNDRLILGPDTTEITGWSGGRGRGAKEMPKYHDQFHRFRGYVFFNSKDPSKLPWNTTKTGMDKDSPDFIYVREHMIKLGKQVKCLLDDLKTEREKDNPSDKRTLNIKIEKAKVVSLSEIINQKSALPSIYKYPKQFLNPAPPNKNRIPITFNKAKLEVDKTKAYFDVETANDAGSLAFDYFYKNAIK